MTPAIFGIAGLILSADERDFFRDADPAGYILFGRNIADRAQVRALTDQLRAIHGRERLFICIDQEGGRVARMRPPEWLAFPPGEAFDRLYDIAPSSAIEAARANAEALAIDLAEVGITVDCHPLLDVRQAGADNVIGDRALGSEPLRVAALGRAILDGLARGGVAGTIKHMPGHLLFTAWDPENPATLSPYVIGEVIRRQIGFDGLLLTDDLDMAALSGTVPERAARAIAAGCDIALNCWAKMDDMVAIAGGLPQMSEPAAARLGRALAATGGGPGGDQAALIARRNTLLAIADAQA